MKTPVQQSISYWLITLLASGILHIFLRYNTFSLVPWPLFISLVLAFTVTIPWQLFIALLVGVELLSSLPPGILAITILLPFVLERFPNRPPTELSWLFFVYVLIISTAQTTLLVATSAFINYGFHMPLSLIILPKIAPMIVIATAFSSIVFIILWQEWVAPLANRRTIPRYKQL